MTDQSKYQIAIEAIRTKAKLMAEAAMPVCVHCNGKSEGCMMCDEFGRIPLTVFDLEDVLFAALEEMDKRGEA
ncbi:hypothetical protein ATL17_1597 [Maritalea mobilis]|uniref:Uncharacterized protein n=1 Tax=Maritalea mobilis TaxID=483324 RepID=A0A4R6VN33_9HYPH|nr:hypothetical protein [Maritalea mobilis]TDQ63590.1 hypothetical protein ATL17_1597 [Maritalea mobilis]